MRRIENVPQMMQTECGLCCATMIANYYKHYTTINDLRKMFSPGREGVSARNICEMLKYVGIEYKIYKCDVNGLLKLNGPMIIYVNRGHFIVIERIKREKVYAIDPAIGNIIITVKELEDIFSGMVISNFIPKNDKKYKKSNKLRNELVPLFFNKKLVILLIVLTSLISYAAAILISYYVQKFFGFESDSKYVLIAIGAIGVYAIFYFINALLGVLYKTDIFKSFYKRMFHKLLFAKYSFYENRPIGGVLFSLGNIESVNEFYAKNLVSAIIALGSIIALGVYIAISSWLLFLIMIGLLAFCSILYVIFSKRVTYKHLSQVMRQAKMSSMQTEILVNIESVKLGGSVKENYSRWEEAFFSVVEKTKDTEKASVLTTTVTACMVTIVPIASILLYIVFSNGDKTTAGLLISLLSIMGIFTQNLTSLLSSFTSFQMIRNYIMRLQDIIEEESETYGALELTNVNEITVSDVTFSYNPRFKENLKNVNMTFKKGNKIAIVGESGCGKSTVTKLIAGLYNPQFGKIKYDGKEIENFDLDSLRKKICLIPQNGKVFSRSILENLTMFSENKGISEELIDLCQRLGLLEEIMRMPMKFETVLSEQGANISGGQRQKILIIRALLSKPDFILMDEATCAMDSVNEKKVYDTLKAYNCSQIVITHRLSTIYDSDYIYVLKNGVLVEEGTHEELINKSGEYSRLYTTE